MPAMRLWPLALAALLLLCACPARREAAQDHANQQGLDPAAPLPSDSPLLAYDKLHLGMSNLDISQAYNAPNGKGDGFTRVIEDYGDAKNQIIQFAAAKDSPEQRRIVMRVYRDQACMIVDRRDNITPAQADAWFEALKKQYGAEPRMTVAGAQWSWGEKDGILLTFTRDNYSETSLSANVVLVHRPTYEASTNYTAAWLKEHPEQAGRDSAEPGSGMGSGA